MNQSEFRALIRWGFVSALIAALCVTLSIYIINRDPNEATIKSRTELQMFRKALAEDIDLMRQVDVDLKKQMEINYNQIKINECQNQEILDLLHEFKKERGK